MNQKVVAALERSQSRTPTPGLAVTVLDQAVGREALAHCGLRTGETGTQASALLHIKRL